MADKREELSELKREYCVLYNTAKKLGNKHPESIPMLKSFEEDIKRLQNELKGE